MKSKICLAASAMAVLCWSLTQFAMAAPPNPAAPGATVPLATPQLPASLLGGNVYSLRQFGSISTQDEAARTLEKAIAAVQASGGGVIVIPNDAPVGWKPENNGQEILRFPAAPAPAKTWKNGPAVTLFDTRDSRLILPQITGIEINRTFHMPDDDSSPHWSYHPIIGIHEHNAGGTSDYEGLLIEPIVAGAAQRFYIQPLRGLFPGQALQAFATPAAVAVTVTVSGLGYDRDSHRPYFIADAPVAFPRGTRLSLHTQVSTIRAETRANDETQTFDVWNIRHHYSQGDSYLFDGYLHYMGDEHSPQTETTPAGPDDTSGFGSVIYNARTRSETNIFRAKVGGYNVQRQELIYAGAANAQTLASGRPLINMNPAKWITSGHAYILQPGGAMLNWGGSLRSKDAPWTKDIVGRYFAIDEPGEFVPTGDHVRRWYLITGLIVDKNGEKLASVQRYWWGAKNQGVGISRLYDWHNFTDDDSHPKLLHYIIAPGTNVYDVADGAGTSDAQSSGAGRRIIRIAPYSDNGSKFDFQPGDSIEQAMGNDPFMPIPWRIWLWDAIPGVFPAPALDISNNGSAARTAAIGIGGSGGFNNVFDVQSDMNNGILVRGKIQKSLFLFHQKHNNPQTITFNRANSLGVDPMNGNLDFNGNWDLQGRGLSDVAGLSGGARQSTEFRGVAVTIPAGVTGFDVVFATSVSDDAYAIKLETSWFTDHAVTTQTIKGFHIAFGTPAPQAATLNWLVIQ